MKKNNQLLLPILITALLLSSKFMQAQTTPQQEFKNTPATFDKKPIITSTTSADIGACYGEGIAATITAGSGGTGYSETYQWRQDAGKWESYTPGTTVGIIAVDSIEIKVIRNSKSSLLDKVVRCRWMVHPPVVSSSTYTVTHSGNNTGYNIQLTASDPTPNTGLWMKISGPGTVLKPMSPTASINGIAPGSTVGIMWLIHNSIGCIDSTVYYISAPLEGLTNFTAMPMEGFIRLNWATASETNNDHFDLERSTDGVSFEKISVVKGNGTVHELSVYMFDDNTAEPNKTYYYRLRQVDNNNSSRSTDIVVASLKGDSNFKVSELMPNPTKEYASMQINVNENTNVKVSLFSMEGRQVMEKTYYLNNGTNNIDLTLDQLDAGTYLCRFETTHGMLMKKLIKTR